MSRSRGTPRSSSQRLQGSSRRRERTPSSRTSSFPKRRTRKRRNIKSRIFPIPTPPSRNSNRGSRRRSDRSGVRERYCEIRLCRRFSSSRESRFDRLDIAMLDLYSLHLRNEISCRSVNFSFVSRRRTKGRNRVKRTAVVGFSDKEAAGRLNAYRSRCNEAAKQQRATRTASGLRLFSILSFSPIFARRLQDRFGGCVGGKKKGKKLEMSKNGRTGTRTPDLVQTQSAKQALYHLSHPPLIIDPSASSAPFAPVRSDSFRRQRGSAVSFRARWTARCHSDDRARSR